MYITGHGKGQGAQDLVPLYMRGLACDLVSCCHECYGWGEMVVCAKVAMGKRRGSTERHSRMFVLYSACTLKQHLECSNKRDIFEFHAIRRHDLPFHDPMNICFA